MLIRAFSQSTSQPVGAILAYRLASVIARTTHTTKAAAMPAVQAHGLVWERAIRHNVWGLPPNARHTAIHDIDASENGLDPTQHVSIKTTGSDSLDLSDMMRFFDYDLAHYRHTIIVVRYKQTGNRKRVYRVLEVEYTAAMHRDLFGTVTRAELDDYVQAVKRIPGPRCSPEDRAWCKAEKERLQKTHGMGITIGPRLSSGGSRRVQCTVGNIDRVLGAHITWVSPPDAPNTLYGCTIPLELVSPCRQRNKIAIHA